jgi:hypothetical protein
MKKTLILAALVSASALNAQSFVAGWDFDDVGSTDSSMTANWGDLAGSALLTWTHSPASPPPPPFTPAEFGVSGSFNSAVVGNTFAFVDPNTGFDQFSDPGGAAEGGFNSLSASDSFTLNFDGTNYTDLALTYAVDAAGDGSSWTVANVDLSSLDGTNVAFVLNTAAGVNYDNFAVTGTVVPEPSAFAAIAGMIAIGFVAARRKRS